MAIGGVILVALLLIVAGLSWPGPGESWKWPRKPRENEQSGPLAAAVPPTSREGILIAQLISGELNQSQYRRAVERLALCDDEAHPLMAPRDNPPDIIH
jgi:hypothetical protein